jgi:AsmA family protein
MLMPWHWATEEKGCASSTAEMGLKSSLTVDLRRERVEIRLRTESKRLTVGVLAVPLLVSGTLKAPSAAPDRAAGAGGGIAGAIATLPTIRFGIGDAPPRCESLVRRARRGRATGSDAGQGSESTGVGRR